MNQFLIAGLLVALALPALGQDLINPLNPVPEHPEVAYLDLLQQVIPDLALQGSDVTGHLPPGIRHIDGPDSAGETPDPVKIDYVEMRKVVADGKPTIWVLADLGGGGNLGNYTLLAVFDASEEPKLIDAAEVDTDQLTGFIGDIVKISAKDEAVVVDSEHSNSDQTYQSLALLFLQDRKLTIIDSFFAFGMQTCTYEQYELVTITGTPASDGMWPIKVVNTRRQVGSLIDPAADKPCIEPQESDFKPVAFAAVYTWDVTLGKYATSSRELESLALADRNLF